MALASQLSGGRIAAARRSSGACRALALMPVFASLLAPASAWADLYKWTDEQGGMVISDIPPIDPSRVRGMKLLATASKPAARSAAISPEPAANTKERELEARIGELERQLREQQAAQQLQPLAQTSDTPGNTPEPPPQLLEAEGYNSQTAEYNSGYYPSPYYAPPLAYSFVVVQARPLARLRAPTHRPAHASRPQLAAQTQQFVGPTPQFVGPTPQFAGPTPQFVGPTPQFVGPTPRFVGPTPQFISQPALAQSAPALPATHLGTRGGGSTRHSRH